MSKTNKFKLGLIILSAVFLAVPFFPTQAEDEYQRPMQITLPKRVLPTEPDPALLVKNPSMPVLVKDSNFEIIGRHLKGFFNLENTTNEIFSNATWRIEIYKGNINEQRWNNEKVHPIGLQYTYVNQSYFTLQPKEKSIQKFDLNLSPYLPAGDYVLKIMASRRNSASYGWDEKAFKLDSDKTGYLEIDENSVELVDSIGKKAYPAQFGWRIAVEKEKPQAKLLIKNPIAETISSTPYFTIWNRGFEKNQKEREIKMDILALAAGEEKTFIFDLPIDFSPGSYHAELSFRDGNGDLQAPPQTFHWVLGGNSGSLESLKINADAFLKKEPIKLTVDAFGRADGLKDEYSAEGKVYNAKGELVFNEKISLIRPALDGNFTVIFPEIQASENFIASRAEAVLYSKDGKLLDSINIEIKPLSEKSQKIVASKNQLVKVSFIIFSAVTAGIILLILAYYFKKKKSGMLLLLFMFCVFSSLFFTNSFADAHWVCDSNYDGCWLPGNCDPAHPYCGAIFTACVNAEYGFSSYPASVNVNESFTVSGGGGGIYQEPCNNPFAAFWGDAWYAPPGSGWIYLGQVGGYWSFNIPGSSVAGNMQVWVRNTGVVWGCSGTPQAWDAHDFVVNVNVIAPPSQDLTLSASPNPVSYNTASTLTWTTTNVAYCRASGDWTGWKNAAGGSESTGNLTSTKTYNLTYYNSNGVGIGTKTVTVNVNGPPLPIISFSASPANISKPNPSTLSWTVTNATSCTASGGWSGSKALNGSQLVYPIQNTQYILSCTNASGTTTVNTTVGVYKCTDPPPWNQNSELCPGDDENLTSNLEIKNVDNGGCTDGRKCEYQCTEEGALGSETCAAPIDGACGTATSVLSCQRPTQNLCANETEPTPVTLDTGYWKWKCEGLYGGEESVQCSAYRFCGSIEVSPN